MIILFWNVNKRELEARIANLALHRDVDILILAECETPASKVLQALNMRSSPQTYLYFPGLCEKLRVFSRLPFGSIAPVYESDRFTIRRVDPPAQSQILLVAVHLPSKRDWAPGSQLLECNSLIHAIESEEAAAGHSRTILLGDVNMNPFESGVVASRGLHATMSRRIAEEGGREVQGNHYKFFYNPMWSHFGDRSGHPPGTYYHRRAEHVCYFWNIYDQCLVRPELLYAFDDSRLEILSSDGAESLLSPRKGHPNASDHLPILVGLDP